MNGAGDEQPSHVPLARAMTSFRTSRRADICCGSKALGMAVERRLRQSQAVATQSETLRPMAVLHRRYGALRRPSRQQTELLPVSYGTGASSFRLPNVRRGAIALLHLHVADLAFAKIFERAVIACSVGISVFKALFAGNDDDQRMGPDGGPFLRLYTSSWVLFEPRG
jgi:hypothetical protein